VLALPIAGLSIAGLSLTAPVVASALSSALPSASPPMTLPDMQLKVPEGSISIGTNSSNGHRQLQFTHITWDAGAGPFEIDPSYDPATGMATWVQAVYDSPHPGVWQFSHSVPLEPISAFDPPFDYRFPLTRFTLNKVNANGSPGSAVATSPKTDYCITADTYVGGVPHTPSQSYIPQNDCAEPTLPLGWSVGWGDEYDQTDNGQPIDLTGVPDGTYLLVGTVDPDHVLAESDPGNNVVDTRLRISGYTVRVLAQTRPVVEPPQVAITTPVNGASVNGVVTLKASASATAAGVSAVQFLLDGEPLGSPVRSAPYTYKWTVGSTPLGVHRLSARVTDSRGDAGTAPVRTVIVTAGNPHGLSIDRLVTASGYGTVTTGRFSTSAADETVVAFAGSDGPGGAGQQSVAVSGAGLRWRLVRRTNSQPGDAEIWTAVTTKRLSGVTVTSTPRAGGYDEFVTVATFRNSAGVGASASASRASGAPSVSLTSTVAGSLSYAVGNDYDNAVPRSLGTGQILVSQWADSATGDTYWVQGRASASPAARKIITLNDTRPATDHWNFAAVEVKPAKGAAPSAAPLAGVVNPAAGQTVSGTIPVAARASDDLAVKSVQFLLDGRPLGRPVTEPPYAIRWTTTAVPNGAHTLAARVTGAGGSTVAAVRVLVQNPAPAMTCFVMQAERSASGHGTLTTRPFHLAAADELLLAFVSSGGPATARQAVTVSGGGLEWRLVRRADARSGDAEIWQATASSVQAAVRVTSTQARTGYQQSLTVIAMEGTDGVGASAAASAASGAPGLRLGTTKPTSLVFAVGSDNSGTVPSTLPRGWVALGGWLRPAGGGTYWSQYTNQPVASPGTVVRVSTTAHAAGDWNLAAVEVPGDGS
jgi:hypothetical protein